MRQFATIAFLVFALSNSTIASDNFFPVQPGWQWQYLKSDGTVNVSEITGITTIMGREVSIKQWLGSKIEEYVSVTETGDVMWHGLEGEAGGEYAAVFFDPPLKLIDGSAKVGDVWEIRSQSYCDRNGEVPFGPLAYYTYTVASVDSVVVPAGQFVATKVTSAAVYVCGGVAWSPFVGEILHWENADKRNQKSAVISYWYAKGIGVVKSTYWAAVFSASSSLQTWSEPELSPKQDSWGDVKTMFR